ncbi:ABC transporter substrate-binding protein [Geobacillus zalihae]|uniref:hypothetical protein n=1 Tax=Geobacillus zalihae TaxID=213419 RepID=UPI001CC1DC5F|nr:hypothetical protein [Geobacillus zalihae]
MTLSFYWRSASKGYFYACQVYLAPRVDKNLRVLGFFVNKDGINVWQDNSFSGSIFTALKADYAFKEKGDEYSDFKTVSLERILEIDPDVLFAYTDPGKNDLKK